MPDADRPATRRSRAWIGAAVVLVIATSAMIGFGPTRAEREAAAWRRLAHRALAAVPADSPACLAPELPASFVAAWRRIRPTPPDGVLGVRLLAPAPAEETAVALRIDAPDGTTTITQRVADASALAPAAIAILIAIAFGKTLWPLAIGVVVGALLLTGFAPIPAATLVVDWVTASARDQFYATLIAFILGLIGMVAIGIRSGGVRGLVDQALRRVRTARGVRRLAPFLGLGIFFDDYSNTVVLGNALRPITDRLRIPREKLAYIVDSTAAPVAGLVLFSTWIWFEVSQIEPPLRALGAIDSIDGAYGVFLQSMPFRFYCLFTLAFVVLNGWIGRDYGPMLGAERRAARGDVGRRGVAGDLGGLAHKPGVPCRARNIAVPLALTIATIAIGLFVFREPGQALGGPTTTGPVLAIGATVGAMTAAALALVQRLLTVRETLGALAVGLRTGGLAVAILFLAWALGRASSEIGTPEYLTAILERGFPSAALPIVLFGVAATVSFATGSSFSTMGILLPIGVPLAYSIAPIDAPLAATAIAIAAVLDGAIFGDHCSPLSDTTVLSSVASGCDHVAHVRTQLPYAMTTMTVALVCGYAPTALGWPPWIGWALGGAACVITLRALGRRPE